MGILSMIVSDKELQAQRLATCLSCDRLGNFMGAAKCKVCHCFIRGKIAVKPASCPLKKW